MTWVPGGNNSTSAPATAAPPKKVVVAHFDGKGKVNLKYEPREDHISAEEREAERLGAFAYLQKPVDFNDLMEVVAQAGRSRHI